VKKRRQLVISIVIFVGLIGILLSSLKTANTQSSNKTENIRQVTNKSDENFLLVSLGVHKQIENTDEIRKKKNEKFDKWSWIRQTVSADATSSLLINDWQVGLPALPVTKSDVVVIGTVNSGEAFLSNDETGIYSEFSVATVDLLKNNQNNLISVGEVISVQRAGGRILYPSGKILKYSVSGQEMPQLNGKYVFFLTYDKQRQTYYIVTAYEISDGKITALDGRGRSKVSGFKFSEYDGIDEQQFISELKNAIDSKKDSFKEVNNP
jgi:hypothetical protein